MNRIFKHLPILTVFVIACCGEAYPRHIDESLVDSYDAAFTTLYTCTYFKTNYPENHQTLIDRQPYMEVRFVQGSSNPIWGGSCAIATVGGAQIAVKTNQQFCPDLTTILTHELLHISGLTHNTASDQFEFDKILGACNA